MTSHAICALQGLKAVNILGLYFISIEGELSEPFAIIFEDCNQRLIAFETNNGGKIRYLFRPIQKLWSDLGGVLIHCTDQFIAEQCAYWV